MAPVPDNPRIYHITHLQNLKGIVQAGVLWSDAKRIELALAAEVVGMSKIKQRRLTEIEVGCHPGTKVGEYVPFYFCPRSVMLYILHRGNHPETGYHGGQRPIIHLQADLRQVVQWADAHGRRWAFTAQNAGTRYVDSYRSVAELSRIDWTAVQSTDWRSPATRERKQAEFLLWESFPWSLVECIGVIDREMQRQVAEVLQESPWRPDVRVEPTWYD
jgi:hypothetical protein